MAAWKLVSLVLLGAAIVAGPVKAQAPAPAPAPAEEDTTPVWYGEVDGNGAAMGFATPNSDDARFTLVCDKKRGVSLTVYEEVKSLKVKRPLTIDLSAGGAKVSLKGATTTDELNGFTFGEAKKITVGPLLAVLRAPGELTVKMADASVTFPAEGRAEKLKIFESGCKVK
jgi:hypothetical protein